MLPTDTILTTIPATEVSRLVVVLVQQGSSSHLELRQQSWGGDGVEWFTQNSIQIESDQVAQLRATLGTGSSAPTLPNSFNRVPKTASWQPKVVRAG